jgi:HD-GYP domain-containing protein (c-di-GMP phosphodiesterase class II)
MFLTCPSGGATYANFNPSAVRVPVPGPKGLAVARHAPLRRPLQEPLPRPAVRSLSPEAPAPQAPLFPHEDPLRILNTPAPLGKKLEAIHAHLAGMLPGVDRVAVASYDRATDLLKTFIASSGPENTLVYYDARLADSPSLQEILSAGRPRVVDDLALFRQGAHPHTQAIQKLGFRSSYTMPLFQDGTFWGFVFFNSLKTGVFTPERFPLLDVVGHLIGALATSEMLAVRVLAAAVRTAHDMVHFRDPETGAHIDRMSRYSRLIALHLGAAGVHRIDDRTIERIFEFAPLHDLGKIGIPDSVLLKQGSLTPQERELMRTHTTRGLAMVEDIARNFGLEHLEGLDLLRNIAQSHHETLDGKGYPRGLKGGEIPLEARIVAVADIFDALTSARTYKAAWSNEEAFATLRKLAKDKLDADCVEALILNDKKVKEIQAQFLDEQHLP